MGGPGGPPVGGCRPWRLVDQEADDVVFRRLDVVEDALPLLLHRAEPQAVAAVPAETLSLQIVLEAVGVALDRGLVLVVASGILQVAAPAGFHVGHFDQMLAVADLQASASDAVVSVHRGGVSLERGVDFLVRRLGSACSQQIGPVLAAAAPLKLNSLVVGREVVDAPVTQVDSYSLVAVEHHGAFDVAHGVAVDGPVADDGGAGKRIGGSRGHVESPRVQVV